ncbi:MAG: AI-2E family transporter [Candidatus Methanoperedens sp.]|nr:AI-2E family transporter [Candidatus Methanoperedens sp.]
MVLSSRLHSRSHPAIFLVAIGIAAIMIYPFITPLILAAITTYMFSPIIKKMESHKLLSHTALTLLIIIIGIPLILSISYLTTNIGQIFGDITGLSGKITYFISVFSDTISSTGLGTYIDLPLGAKEITAKLSSITIGIISGFVTSIPLMFLDIVVFLYATYYFMRNGNEIIRAVKDYALTLPQEDEKFISSIIKGLKKSFDVLILSYLTMAVITAAVSFIGYYIFGVPHAFLLAILTGLFGFLPVFGTWMVYGPAAAYMYYIGNTFAAGGILVFGVVVLSVFIPMVLQPYFGSKQADVNPLAIFIGFFSGPIIFGTKGLLLGPIIFVVVQTIIHEYIKFRTEIEKNPMVYYEE